MSDWLLNDLPVTSGTLAVPRLGVWVADLEAVAEEPPTGAVTLSVGGAGWRGTVLRGGVTEGRWRGRVVGGAGGLWRAVAARQYQSTPRRLVVAAILSEVGEQLAADASGLDDVLTTWARLAEPAARALGRLVAAWRALPDGTLTTAPWPSTDAPDAELVEELPDVRAEAFAVESLALLPNMTRGGRVAASVTYALRGPAMRATVTYDA